MKKHYHKLMLVFLTFSLSNVNAQSFKAKQIDLNVGLGLGSSYRSYYGSASFGYRPPISISGDYGITEDISLGVYLGYTGLSYKYYGTDFCNNGGGNGNIYNYTDTYSWSFYIVGLRGAYHFAKLVKDDKIDLYGGLMLGRNFITTSYSSTSICSNHIHSSYNAYPSFAYSLFGGCRYRFSEKFGGFGEIGYGLSYLTLGLNIKIQ